MNNTVALYDDNFVVRSIIKKIDSRYTLLVNTNRYLVARDVLPQIFHWILKLVGIQKRKQNCSTLLWIMVRDNHLNDSKRFSCPTGLYSQWKNEKFWLISAILLHNLPLHFIGAKCFLLKLGLIKYFQICKDAYQLKAETRT